MITNMITPNKALKEYFEDEIIRLGGEWEKSLDKKINNNENAIILRRSINNYNIAFLYCTINRKIESLSEKRIKQLETKCSNYFTLNYMKDHGIEIAKIYVSNISNTGKLFIEMQMNYAFQDSNERIIFDNFDDLKKWLEKNNYINFEDYLR